MTLHASCTSAIQNANQPFESPAEGFINPDCFQVIVNQKPSATAEGVVGKRESAFFEAKAGMYDRAAESLLAYSRSIFPDGCVNPDEITDNQLKDSLIEYARRGFIFEEYYDRDGSVNLVYRIIARSLQNEINSTIIEIKKSYCSR